MFLYRLFRGMFRILYRFVYRWEIIGLENVPLQGGVILCSNHKNNLDPPFIASPIQRQVHFMAKEELFKIPVISYLVKQFGAYPVKRGMSDKGALKKSLQILKEGKVLGIFPEGTRSKDGKLGKPYPGAALFALKSEAAVIPTAVIGDWKMFQSMRVVYGKPINMTELRQQKVTSALTEEASGKIMKEIQQLIDEYS
ncbi:lysophospholipid acyltransferase family protein [Ammoniphilus resinae]|uniref:1-acyl-sn-glycerol-3-phosphate acyltransferase n=1 Tax=Ammoniphilus resinae TaxID=861532 RepID=A0ABS4GTN1_9BACL|nr:lysophospholipid acyltransferase family protein [Ammoniphilus resinae]MBP1933477.1 1-acyl-sn-glycerol-3-phosphate acyltransferase [Ammoniphilus resinae]